MQQLLVAGPVAGEITGLEDPLAPAETLPLTSNWALGCSKRKGVHQERTSGLLLGVSQALARRAARNLSALEGSFGVGLLSLTLCWEIQPDQAQTLCAPKYTSPWAYLAIGKTEVLPKNPQSQCLPLLPAVVGKAPLSLFSYSTLMVDSERGTDSACLTQKREVPSPRILWSTKHVTTTGKFHTWPHQIRHSPATGVPKTLR